MKKVLFCLVSAFVAGTALISNLSKDVVSSITKSSDNELSVTEQNQSLILEKSVNWTIDANGKQLFCDHYSHSSHVSHSSHRSHSSHYSSRFV